MKSTTAITLLGLTVLPAAAPAGAHDGRACDALSVEQCLASAECTLAQAPTRSYLCRPAQGDCEIGFRQSDARAAEHCESKPGCQYLPAVCFCGPGLQCVCGGGPPSRCVERGSEPDAMSPAPP